MKKKSFLFAFYCLPNFLYVSDQKPTSLWLSWIFSVECSRNVSTKKSQKEMSKNFSPRNKTYQLNELKSNNLKVMLLGLECACFQRPFKFLGSRPLIGVKNSVGLHATWSSRFLKISCSWRNVTCSVRAYFFTSSFTFIVKIIEFL